MRMTAAEFKQLGGAGRSKYGNTKTERSGVIFASKGEAALNDMLEGMQAAGEILFFLRQVPFHLPGGVIYRVDFAVVAQTGIRYLDFKGYETPEFKIKKKLVEALYPVRIELVARRKGRLIGL